MYTPKLFIFKRLSFQDSLESMLEHLINKPINLYENIFQDLKVF